jgi:hypothetical protein
MKGAGTTSAAVAMAFEVIHVLPASESGKRGEHNIK